MTPFIRAARGLLKLAEAEKLPAPDAVEGEDGTLHCTKCGCAVPEKAQACHKCGRRMRDVRAHGRENEVLGGHTEQESSEKPERSTAESTYGMPGATKVASVLYVAEGSFGFTKLARAGANPILNLRRARLLKKRGLLPHQLKR